MRSELNRYIGNHNSQDVMSEISDNASLPTGDVSRLADHLFRHEAGKLISVLTGIFGINRLQLAEDVVQESLVRALRTWPYAGIPKNPAACLTQTAKNAPLVRTRRQTFFTDKERRFMRSGGKWPSDPALPECRR